MLFRVTLLFLLSVPILVGYLWMFISTFAVRTHGLMPVDAQGNVGGLTLANWAFLKDPVLWTALGNTFLLAAGLTAFTVLISSMAGYALARIQFRFRKQFLSLTLVLHAFPSVTLLIALYFVLKGLSASPILGPWIGYNTMGGVILVSVSMQLPLGIWLMKGFFDGLSWDVERSALLDGCTRLGVFWRVALPMAGPGVCALSIFSFITGWGSFLIPYTFMMDQGSATLATYLMQSMTDTAPAAYGTLAAIGLFQTLPILGFFLFTQKYLMTIYTGGRRERGSPMELELKNLTKIYDKLRAVDGIDLKIRDGEFVVFLGPSGCGKTTTLMMTAGLIEPTRGEIRFDGKNVAAVHPKDRQIGMVFQTYALYPHMTVFDNMTFALKLNRVPASERRARSGKVAGWLGLADLMDRMPGELSGGQQQRVSVGRALIKEPKLLLFDEPLSNLDANLRANLRGEIKRLQTETGITSLYVTHDQAEAMAMADRVAVIMEGRLIAFAPPKDLHDRPTTRRIAEFIGVPSMNFFETELSRESDGLTARFRGGEVTLDTSRRPDDGSRRAVLGIRPQHLRESSEGLPCEVRNVEHLGRDLLVTVRMGAVDATFYADSASNATIGQTLRVGFDMGHAQFFDPKSGKSLLWN